MEEITTHSAHGCLPVPVTGRINIFKKECFTRVALFFFPNIHLSPSIDLKIKKIFLGFMEKMEKPGLFVSFVLASYK